MVISIFIFHVILLILLILLCRNQNIQEYQFSILFSVIIYNYLFRVPIIYLNLNGLGNVNYLPICFINLVSSQIIILTHLYFMRADTIKDNMPFLKLNYSFILEITYQTLIEVSTILFSFNIFIGMRFVILFCQGTLQLLISLQYLIDYNFTINFISLILMISLYAKLTFYEFALSLMLLIYLAKQINVFLIDRAIWKFSEDNHNIIILLKHLLDDQLTGQRFFLLEKIKSRHNCLKCSTNNDMLFCLIKKQLKEEDPKLSILYCNEVAKYAPLKALLKLSQKKLDHIYYKVARMNLISTLSVQCAIIQEELTRLSRAVNQEKSLNLDSLIVFNTISIYESFISQLKNVIKLKIHYWNELIKGHQNGEQLLESTLLITQSMLEIRSQISNHYDLKISKLITSQNYDIISLKILQIYNSAIYPDGFNSFKIETITNDLLRNDRFLKEDVLDNIKLLENRVIALRMSVTSINNQFIDLNVKKLSEFLGESVEYTQSLSSVNQLLPMFVQQIHSQLIDRFTQRGYSKLSLKGASTYYQDKLQYLVPVTIYLNINYIDNNDLIINAILVKANNVKTIMLFNEQGKILGLSQGFKDTILKQDQRISQFSSGKISIYQFLPALEHQVQLLQKQILTQGSSELNNLKGEWTHKIPEDTQSNLIAVQPIQQRSTLRFDGEVKYTLNSILPVYSQAQFPKTETHLEIKQISTFNFQDKDIFSEKQLSQYGKQETQKFDYSINYSQIELPGTYFGYYTLTINEAKMTNNFIAVESMNQLLTQQMQEDEEIQKPLVTYYKQNNETLLPNQNETLQESNRIAASQPFIQTLKEIQYKADIKVYTRPQNTKQPTYANFFNARQDLRADQSTNSRGSDITTSKETLQLTQNLYTNEQMNQLLLKNSMFILISILSMVAFIIFNVQFIKIKLQDQENSILDIYMSQNINYIMTSYYYQSFQILLDQDNVSDSSPFIQYWNEQVLIPVYKYARPQINQMILQLQQQGAQIGNQSFIQVPFLDNGVLVNQSCSITEFYTKMNQIYEVMQRNLVVNKYKNYQFPELKDDIYLRMTLLPMLEFQDKLIQQTLDSTILQQGTIAPLFFNILIVELVVILLFQIIQAIYWKKLDGIILEIILLVPRINESDAIVQRTRLNETLAALSSTRNDWKTYNYFNISFGQVYNTDEKYTSTLLNRIREKSYRKNSNYIIIISIFLVWLSFILIGYQIHMYKNDQFQPSLTAAMKYSKFRHSFDASFILAGLIKTETLLPLKSNRYINQSDTILWFQYFTKQLLPTINDVTNVLLTSAKGDVTIFDNILSGDLCKLMPEILIMCHSQDIRLKTYEKDYYNDLIKSGAIGYTSSYIKFINQNYNQEFETMAYTGDKLTVNTKEFQNFVLQYVLDIMESFRRFLPLFQQNNETIANGILQLVEMYYYIVGFMQYFILTRIITIFCGVQLVWIRKAQLNCYSLLQVLSLIPLDQISNSAIRMRVTLIQKQLF